MNRRRYARLLIPAIAALGLLALIVPPAAAADFPDGWTGTLNGCTITSFGANDTGPITNGWAYNQNSCGKATCFRELYSSGGSLHWAPEAPCTSGVAGQYSIGTVQSGTYWGRQIRVNSSCWWDSLLDNPTPHACI